MKKPTAVVVGVGAEQGIGAAVCRRFAVGGHHVIVAGRTLAKVSQVAHAIVAAGGSAEPFAVDATNEADVKALFDHAMAATEEREPADSIVFNAASLNRPMEFRELSARDFEDVWRQNCFAGFLVGREAAIRLAPLGRGTVLFTGASGSLRGRPRFAQFAAAKSGLRMLAQSMAREFGPLGLHVAHIVIDGGVAGDRLKSALPDVAERAGKDGLLDVDDVAEHYWMLHRQPRSTWTHELDLRPYKESF
ncbi:MAG: SDR family NAD(P)-dependent oxidoreductase [Gammaproteobacteria bacterium]|nr:SDR family NAD(P)-dependent oxidoreductase [Gammaproteobacteria bacterium]